MQVIEKIESGIKPLARIAAVAGVFAGLGVVYWFFMDNIYRPSVKIVSVDYKKGIAVLDMAGKIRTLYTGSKLSAGGHWGVQFSGPIFGEYNRVELVKDDITYQVLDLSPEEGGPTAAPIAPTT